MVADLRGRKGDARKSAPDHRRSPGCRHIAKENTHLRNDRYALSDISAVTRSRSERDLRSSRDRDGQNRWPSRQQVRGSSCCLTQLLDIDGEFRTIGLCEPSLVFEVRRNPTVADFPAAAEFVCFKKFWRESNAASVTLTERAVDAHSQRDRGRGF